LSCPVRVALAINMATQYSVKSEQPQKKQIAAFRGGYHGDTFAAMSVCDPVTCMHHLFQGSLAQQHFAPMPQLRPPDPWQPTIMAPLAQLLEQHHHQLAAFILEPVVQGAGGMRFHHPRYVTEAKRLCE